MTANNSNLIETECEKLSRQIRAEDKAVTDFINSIDFEFEGHKKKRPALFTFDEIEGGLIPAKKNSKMVMILGRKVFGKPGKTIMAFLPITRELFAEIADEPEGKQMESLKERMRYQIYDSALKYKAIKPIRAYAPNEMESAFERASKIDRDKSTLQSQQ